MPGILTSRIRHLVWPTHSDTKNSSADEKARTAKPNTLSRLGSDSRTDSSSSTTDTRSPVGTKNTPFCATLPWARILARSSIEDALLEARTHPIRWYRSRSAPVRGFPPMARRDRWHPEAHERAPGGQLGRIRQPG